MKTHLALAALLGVASLGMPRQAQAGSILFTTGPIDGTLAADPLNGGTTGAEEFTLSAASALTGVTFGSWISTGTGNISALDWSINAVAGVNTLGSVLDSGTGAAVSNVLFGTNGGYTVNSSSFSLPSVALASGTYYLELSNALPSNQYVYWDLNNTRSGNFLASGNPQNQTASLTITGNTAVPEPVSMGLLGTGLLGLIAARRRRG